MNGIYVSLKEHIFALNESRIGKVIAPESATSVCWCSCSLRLAASIATIDHSKRIYSLLEQFLHIDIIWCFAVLACCQWLESRDVEQGFKPSCYLLAWPAYWPLCTYREDRWIILSRKVTTVFKPNSLYLWYDEGQAVVLVHSEGLG